MEWSGSEGIPSSTVRRNSTIRPRICSMLSSTRSFSPFKQRNDGVRRLLDKLDQVRVDDQGTIVQPRQLNHSQRSRRTRLAWRPLYQLYRRSTEYQLGAALVAGITDVQKDLQDAD